MLEKVVQYPFRSLRTALPTTHYAVSLPRFPTTEVSSQLFQHPYNEYVRQMIELIVSGFKASTGKM